MSDNPAAPVLFPGGVVNAASFAPGTTLAPGGLVSVFGRKLASATSVAASTPLPTNLNRTTLTVGGVDAPLVFASDGQINAQLPFELAADSRTQVLVRAPREGSSADALTVPETVTIAPAQPALFATNQQGTGQGAILNGQGTLVDSRAPATAGDVVQVFATGLGITNPRVASGQVAPSTEPLARVAGVEARIGGKPAAVLFAGLAPGFVGLYQVNVQIPAGAGPDPAAPLVLLQNGVPSNTVTLAIR